MLARAKKKKIMHHITYMRDLNGDIHNPTDAFGATGA